MCSQDAVAHLGITEAVSAIAAGGIDYNQSGEFTAGRIDFDFATDDLELTVYLVGKPIEVEIDFAVGRL